MGNAMGNFKEIVDIMEKYPSLGGFYIWDWVDQGIKTQTENGEEYIGYGGDFGEVTHDYNFCLNGVVLPDLSKTGKLAEVKYVYQNADIKWNKNKTNILISNKNYFVDLNRYKGKWELLKNGKLVKEGSFSLPGIAPQKSSYIKTPIDISKLDKQHEWLLNLQLISTKDELWASKAYPVVEEQLVIQPFDFNSKAKKTGPFLISKQDEGKTIVLSNDKFSVAFDSKEGILKNYTYNGELLFENGPKLNFWRATTDNDTGNRLKKTNSKFATKWHKTGLNDLQQELISATIEENKIIANYKILANQDNGFNAKVIYAFYEDGSINFDFDVEAFGSSIRNLPSLPKVGTQWLLPEEMDNMEWYGKGPFHNYIDRANGTFIGNYSASVEEQFVNYPYPQENGNKMDVRWAMMDNGNGLGLKISGYQPLEVSAHHYATKNLDEATHTHELQRTENVYWNIDYKQCGLGNSSCGSNTRKEYCISPSEKFNFSYRMEPIQTPVDRYGTSN
jgi:beta-galactosidase/beta-glucuronidase